MRKSFRHPGALALIVTALLVAMCVTAARAEKTADGGTPAPDDPYALSAPEAAAEEFLCAWADWDFDAMIRACSSEWRESLPEGRDPGAALYAALEGMRVQWWGLRTSRETEPGVSALVAVRASVTRADGTSREWLMELHAVLDKKAEAWRIDPRSLESRQSLAASRTPAPQTPAPSPRPVPTQPPTPPPVPEGGTILYYNPDGGTRYHVDPYCPSASPEYLPFAGNFTWTQISDPRFRALVPSAVCGAPPRPGSDGGTDADADPVYGRVHTPNGLPLNVRSQPKTMASTDGTRLPNGTICLILACVSSEGAEWYRIRFRDIMGETGEGWVLGDYFAPIGESETGDLPDALILPEEGDAAANVLLYYNPNGGLYYHRLRACPSVSEQFLPLEGVFAFCELNHPAYRTLKPCTFCGAPVRPE